MPIVQCDTFGDDLNIRYKVEWEMVSAISHPEYYQNELPIVSPFSVPDEHWHIVNREGDEDSIKGQYVGLIKLKMSGELIRRCSLYKAETETIDWQEIDLRF